MSSNYHDCQLPLEDTSGLPRLAPNANCIRKWIREMRKWLLIHPFCSKTKELFRSGVAILEEKKRHATGPNFYVIHPMSIGNIVLQTFFFMTWSFILVIQPIEMMLKGTVKAMDTANSLIMGVNWFQMLLVILQFNVGYIDETSNTIVLQTKKIALRYLKTYFIFDLLAATFVVTDLTRAYFLETLLDRLFFFGCRVLGSSLRIPTLMKMLDRFLKFTKLHQGPRYVICEALKIFFILHQLTALAVLLPWIAFSYSPRFVTESWTQRSHWFEEPLLIRYIECLMFVACHFFGISYKFDIIMPIEQVLTSFISFFGRLYTLYLLADILRLLGIAGISESLYERQFSLLERYLLDQHVPDNLRIRVLHFFRNKYQGQYFQEKAIVNALSESLRTELFLFAGKRMIEKVAILKKLPSLTLGLILSRMQSEMYSTGDIVLEVGTEVDEIYFIARGTVVVMTRHGDELYHLKDGDLFGIDCLFFEKTKYTMVAAEITDVFSMKKNDLMSVLSDYPEVMNKFTRSAKEIMGKLDRLKKRASMKNMDLLSQLQGGKVLERRTKKHYNFE